MHTIIYCPVCGRIIRFQKICSNCGYESGCDYELFPTLGPVKGDTASTSAKSKQWENQRIWEAVNEMKQYLLIQMQEQTEIIRNEAKTATNQAIQEAELAKQKIAELEQKLSHLGEGGISSPQPLKALIDISNNTCTFGSYPQDADGTVRPILWRVLEIDHANQRALLLSDKILDCRPYYTENEDINWDKAGKDSKGLRYWLNHDFYQKAFSSRKEQNAILTITVDPHANPNPKYRSDQGEYVHDKIFLLSAREMIRFFAKSKPDVNGIHASLGGSHAAAQSTAYVKNKTKIQKDDNGNSYWWLRNMGRSNTNATVVNYDGDIYLGGYSVHSDTVGVRPALWVDLDSFSRQS